jgi:hypothetical protein
MGRRFSILTTPDHTTLSKHWDKRKISITWIKLLISQTVARQNNRKMVKKYPIFLN